MWTEPEKNMPSLLKQKRKKKKNKEKNENQVTLKISHCREDGSRNVETEFSYLRTVKYSEVLEE